MKYVQEDESEPNPTKRRINQLVEVHQIKEGLVIKHRAIKIRSNRCLTKELKLIALILEIWY
jgi:hypothetical protein